jgi:hypothetical protein
LRTSSNPKSGSQRRGIYLLARRATARSSITHAAFDALQPESMNGAAYLRQASAEAITTGNVSAACAFSESTVMSRCSMPMPSTCLRTANPVGSQEDESNRRELSHVRSALSSPASRKTVQEQSLFAALLPGNSEVDR